MSATAGDVAVLERVSALLDGFRSRASAAEERRRVPDESIEELAAAGLFRALQPRRFGGLESDPMVFFEAVRRIATACGSTGWVASILGVHAWQLGLFPAEAQDDVWGDDSATLVSSSYAPTGQVEAVDGGYRLRGRWHFSSGADHARWVFLGGAVPGPDGTPVDFGTFLVPRADYVVDDVWDTVGLRGTGSNDIVIDEADVPAHRFLSFRDTAVCRGAGQLENEGPLYRLPFASVFSNTITAPIVGMAAGAYDAHVATMRERFRVSYGQRVVEDAFAQVRVARAASEIDAAWLQLERNMVEMTTLAAAGQPIPIELRVRTRRDQVRGTERAIWAVDQLFENSGGGSLRRGGAVERAWRDAHAGRVHAVNDPERALSLFAKHELGLSVLTELMW